MKTPNNFILRLLVIAQAIVVCSSSFMPIALAASKADLDYGDLTKLAGLETVIYGSDHKSLPNEKRVDSLEKILFGKSKDGPLHPRIYAIAAALNGKNENDLQPPIAPELDRGDTFKGNLPPIAPESNGQDDYNVQTPSEAKQDRVQSLLQQALQFYGQGQTNQAEALFKNVLTLDNRNTDANFNLGAIAESNPNDQDIKSAVESMQSKIASGAKGISKNTSQNKTKLSGQQIDQLRSRVNQASSDYEKGNYDNAITNLEAVLAQAPDQADVYFALGQAYKAKGQNQDAINAFSQALKLSPNNQQYSEALAELNNSQKNSNSVAHHGTDTFSSNNPDLSQNKSGQTTAYQNNNSNTPDGQITPFSDQGSNNLGWQPASSNRSYNGSTYMPATTTSSYMPGYTYSNYIPYNMAYSMQRAAIGGLAGAAIGSMFAGRGYRMRGAMTGGMIGGMMGSMGGRRW
jgi:tetratricopeptide (TPR) repeat protein